MKWLGWIRNVVFDDRNGRLSLTSLIQNRVDRREKEVRHNVNTSFQRDLGLVCSRSTRHGSVSVYDGNSNSRRTINEKMDVGRHGDKQESRCRRFSRSGARAHCLSSAPD